MTRNRIEPFCAKIPLKFLPTDVLMRLAPTDVLPKTFPRI